MTTYMAIVKGEKAKSLRKRRWVLQIDQTLDTPIKMSSENSPKAVEKLVLQPQKKAKDRRNVLLLLTSLVPRRRLLLLLPESRYLLASCVPYRAVHHAAAARFIFCFFPQRSNSVCLWEGLGVRRSRVQIPVQVRKLWFHLPFWMTISEDDSHMESFRIEEFFFWGQCLFVAKCLWFSHFFASCPSSSFPRANHSKTTLVVKVFKV